MTQIVVDIPASLATITPSSQQVEAILLGVAMWAAILMVMGVVTNICATIDKRGGSMAPPYRAPSWTPIKKWGVGLVVSAAMAMFVVGPFIAALTALLQR